MKVSSVPAKGLALPDVAFWTNSRLTESVRVRPDDQADGTACGVSVAACTRSANAITPHAAPLTSRQRCTPASSQWPILGIWLTRITYLRPAVSEHR